MTGYRIAPRPDLDRLAVLVAEFYERVGYTRGNDVDQGHPTRAEDVTALIEKEVG